MTDTASCAFTRATPRYVEARRHPHKSGAAFEVAQPHGRPLGHALAAILGAAFAVALALWVAA